MTVFVLVILIEANFDFYLSLNEIPAFNIKTFLKLRNDDVMYLYVRAETTP